VTPQRRTVEVPSSPATAIRGGRTLFISGITGARPDGTIPVGDIDAQVEQAFGNLEQDLRAGGGTLRDLVKVNVYVAEESAARAADLRAIRQRHLPSEVPLEVLLRVGRSGDPDRLIEIEAIAVLPDEPAGAAGERAASTGGLVIVAPSDRIIKGAEQTRGMVRESGVTPETAGARQLWTGYVTTPPGMVSGAHHHGDAESSIFVVAGHARFTWGDQLEHGRDTSPGDFIYVPPRVIHAERNLSDTEPFVFVVSRNSGTMTTVNVEVGDPSCEPA
jgi:uncharacterized RmlC-like cupin family protein/enamine deaminase RidA (YjgF/YER057c/UK114 family)